MTTDQINELRQEHGFVSPLQPLEPGEATVMFQQRGTFEWMVHPDLAFRYLLDGITVAGKVLTCRVVDCFPLMNALMLRAQDTDANATWIDASSAIKSEVEPILDATPHRSTQAAG